MDKNELVKAAREARHHAHAPYSRFSVGAALRTKSGRVFIGCNVESISLGLTMCAEQGAISAAIAAGETELVSVAVVTDSVEPALPCGRCRQLLAEFNGDIEVITATLEGKTETFRLGQLLPRAKQGILESHDARVRS